MQAQELISAATGRARVTKSEANEFLRLGYRTKVVRR